MMAAKYNPDIHRRRSIRLKDYDYSQPGAYFVTVCTQNKECLFGDIVDREMRLNGAGEMVMKSWEDLPNHYGNVSLDEFVIMPNHIHGIIVLQSGHVCVGVGLKPTPTIKLYPLSEIVRALKTFSAKRINASRNTPGTPVWQRNYYEHVIRNDDELNRIREYIVNNPAEWAEDKENPGNLNRNGRIIRELPMRQGHG